MKFVKKLKNTLSKNRDISIAWVNFLKYQNMQAIEYLSGLDTKELNGKVDDISFDLGMSSAATTSLRQEGICIIKNFLDRGKCGDYLSDIEKLLGFDPNERIDLEKKLIVVDDGSKSYGEMSNHETTVINIRCGADQGMIDVFNIDKVLPCFAEIKKQLIQSKILNDVLDKQDLKGGNLNVYINRGITSTRGLHVDTLKPKVKFFIYLTDVLKLMDGPYCYVKKSHNSLAFKLFHNEMFRLPNTTTDTSLTNINELVPVLAPKGSMIISDQAGIHRGFPQESIGYRVVLVLATK